MRLSHLGERVPPARLAALMGAAVMVSTATFWPDPLTDTDSARLVSAFAYVATNGPRWLVESQSVWGPFAILAPATWIGGIGAAAFASGLTIMALGAVIGFIAWRASGSLWGAAVASLVLVSSEVIVGQTAFLPMYPAMLAAGYAGAGLAWRSHDRAQAAVGAGLLIYAASELHGVGQVFVLAPAVVAAVRWQGRSSLVTAARTYGVIAVLAIPRLVANLADGGLSGVRKIRVDFMTENGYLRLINTELNENPTGGPLAYLADLGPTLLDALDGAGVAVVLALVGAAAVGGRARALIVIAPVAMAVAMVLQEPRLFPRYWMPVLPGLAIVAGMGAAHLLASARRFHRYGSVAVGAVVVLASMTTAVATHARIDDRTSNRTHHAEIAALRSVAALVDDGKAVIGTRATQLNRVDPDLVTLGTQFMSEEDFVTYLTWPSTAEVVAMMERIGAGWAFTVNNDRREIGQHETWLEPVHGGVVRHNRRLRTVSGMCEVASVRNITPINTADVVLSPASGGFRLFRIGPCPDGFRPLVIDGGLR